MAFDSARAETGRREDSRRELGQLTALKVRSREGGHPTDDGELDWVLGPLPAQR